ncbi:hypothetical protein ACFSC3_04360 [Sphingomonas floccifaciens]|uniref:DUF4350 domain-containing protein n=1 Tax=Sphingomonas floccifaciens TaxID=1844115 RepID=A0ABW4N9R7_9SPHN
MSGPADTLFRARTVVILLVIGIGGFIGTLIMGAYAPDLRSGRDGGGHALSNAATGYRAIVELAQATGRNPRIVRDTRLFGTPDLLIATPERASVNISAAVAGRDYKPTLFVLPKWQTEADPDRSDWVRRKGLLPLSEPIGVLAPGTRFQMRRVKSGGMMLTNVALPAAVAFRAPRVLQVITDASFTISPADENEDGEVTEDEMGQVPRLIPLITDGNGGIVLARLGDAPRFVLAEPDLIDNLGMKDIGQARAALALFDALDPRKDRGIAFDVTFNGLGRSRSPLKLAFEPPFLSVTLTIAAALLLVGLNALGRFGPVVPRPRAIAYGKTALLDNSAGLVRRAGREARMGGRYAAAIRDRAARIFGAPARLKDTALTAYLDTLGHGRRFSELASDAESATDRRSVLQAALALHRWQAGITRRHR